MKKKIMWSVLYVFAVLLSPLFVVVDGSISAYEWKSWRAYPFTIKCMLDALLNPVGYVRDRAA